MVQSVTEGRRGRGGRVTAVSTPIGRGLEAFHPPVNVVVGRRRAQNLNASEGWADFVLDWTRLNRRETVMMALADKYNAFHYELHKEYLKYATHEEALSGGTSLVEKPRECLCQRWASSTFKDISQRNKCNRRKQRVKHTGGRKSFVRILEEKRETTPNLVAFYKEVHWSRKKGKFINATSEHNYNLMVEKLNEREPDEDDSDVDAAEEVFKEVLGQKSGYAQGLGHAVIPEPSPSMRKNKDFVRLFEENEKNKAAAEKVTVHLESLLDGMAAMRKNFYEYEQQMNIRMSELESHAESQRETQA
ncbi:hypothetical protein F2P56_030804 [Juglans regia]|uniref:Uncharacterized protein n=1 Tax=Juglans regia TaxID=51240 RepID=A0A833UFC5_JUGRE|nr:hypothetical protein F2P56_030804 [Juglans regia]